MLIFWILFQLMTDGTFTMAALEWQVRVTEQISKYFSPSNTKFLTTVCVILELEKLGKLYNCDTVIFFHLIIIIFKIDR